MPQITIRNNDGDIVRQDVLSRRVAVFTDNFGFDDDLEAPDVIKEIKALQKEGFTGLEADPSEWTITELREFYRKLQGTEYEDIIFDEPFAVRNTNFDAFDIDFDEQEGIFYPAVVESVEYDHEGEVSSLMSACGETENRRSGDHLPDVTIEGVLTESQLPEIKTLDQGQETTVISDIHSGRVLVKRVTITQNTDIIEYVPDNGESELAFAFQLQLGQPDDES